MKVARLKTFPGPNRYAQEPAIAFAVKGMAKLRQGFDKQLIATLLTVLPGMRDRSCLANLLTDPDRGCNHCYAHVCQELQILAGSKVACSYESCFDRGAKNTVVIGYEDPVVGALAAELANDLMEWALMTVHSTGAARASDLELQIRQFVAAAAKEMLPIQDRELRRRAKQLDIPSYQISGRVLAFGQGRLQKRLSGTKTSLTNVVSNDLAANKDYSRRLLGRLGLPVPRYQRVYRSSKAVAAAKDIGFPVVVKPNNGGMGRGVSVGVKTVGEVREAFKRARARDHSILVEQQVTGSDYRLLVINGEVCAAAKRVPGHVVGDGRHTVGELLEQLNSDPRRGTGPTASWTKISLDDQARRLLAEMDYDTSTVPRNGEAVYLRRNANTSDGGTAIDVTDDVHPDNRLVAIRAARAIGLDIAGVDILSPDIAESMWHNGGKICEVNSRPGIRKHMWPSVGKGRDVTTPILRMLFGERDGRVPVIAIIGDGDTSGVACLVAQQLERSGHHVGLSLTSFPKTPVLSTGTVLAGEHGPASLTLDPDVDTIVTELDAAQVLSSGLDLDVIDVTIVVDSTNPPPGAEGPEGAAATSASSKRSRGIRVVARTTRRAIVVDAANPSMADIEKHCGQAQICLVDTGEQLREARRTVLRGEAPQTPPGVDGPDRNAPWARTGSALLAAAGVKRLAEKNP